MRQENFTILPCSHLFGGKASHDDILLAIEAELWTFGIGHVTIHGRSLAGTGTCESFDSFLGEATLKRNGP